MTKIEAVAIAKTIAAEENWPWEEPVRVTSGFRVWKIMTNADKIGRNVRIRLKKSTGEVVYKGFALR